MELEAQHPLVPLLDGHGHALVVGDHLQLFRHIGGDQGVVTGHRQRARQAGEGAVAMVLDEGALAVDYLLRRADGAAVGFAQRLMTEADAEDRHPAAGQLDEIDEAAGLVGGARSRREHQHRIPITGFDLLHDAGRRQAVAVDAHRIAEGAELIHQVISERIEVIEQEDVSHGAPPWFSRTAGVLAG
ncbi:hypothetical protein D3C84_718860 [compost metagenome]